ncbi:MAG: hypothetical protein JW983_08015 [Elusimicrobia bacterium]|nr:hypothetical protein [Elusimicrobiota bacterium]
MELKTAKIMIMSGVVILSNFLIGCGYYKPPIKINRTMYGLTLGSKLNVEKVIEFGTKNNYEVHYSSWFNKDKICITDYIIKSPERNISDIVLSAEDGILSNISINLTLSNIGDIMDYLDIIDSFKKNYGEPAELDSKSFVWEDSETLLTVTKVERVTYFIGIEKNVTIRYSDKNVVEYRIDKIYPKTRNFFGYEENNIKKYVKKILNNFGIYNTAIISIFVFIIYGVIVIIIFSLLAYTVEIFEEYLLPVWRYLVKIFKG